MCAYLYVLQVLDSKTVLLPNIFDPSELRSDITGKVVRYLQENGAQVNSGEAFVEVEAMKVRYGHLCVYVCI